MAEAPRPSREQIDFIEENIRAIGSVSTSASDRAWWATWVAAKNPFLSRVSAQFERIWKTGTVPECSCFSHASELVHSIFASFKFSTKLWFELPSLQKAFSAKLREAKDDSRKAYVLKTFAYPKSFGADFEDPFFPGLRKYLEANGFKVITVIHPIGAMKEASRLGPEQKSAVFPFQVFVRRSDLFRAYWTIFTSFFRRYRDIRFRGKDVSALIGRQYRLDLGSPSGVEHLLYFEAFKRIAGLFKPTHFGLTLENNPFERMCVSGMRARSPGTKIVGYQHSTINMAALNMYPASGEIARSPHPDLLLTTGEEPARNLKRHGHYDDPALEVRSACALRYQYLQNILADRRAPQKVLLAVLDGVPQAKEQIDFLVREAPSLKGWRIILREHPALTLRDLEVNLAELKKIPHLEVSKGSLQQDLDGAGAVLYCESTVPFEAIARGIAVIHWDNGHILNNDPLFYCTDLKWEARGEGSLSRVLGEIMALPLNERERLHVEAINYLKKYFYPVNEQSLRNFL